MEENDFQKISTQVYSLVDTKYELIKLTTLKRIIELLSNSFHKSIMGLFFLFFYIFANISGAFVIADFYKSSAKGFLIISLLNLFLFLVISLFGKKYFSRVIKNKLTKSFFN